MSSFPPPGDSAGGPATPPGDSGSAPTGGHGGRGDQSGQAGTQGAPATWQAPAQGEQQTRPTVPLRPLGLGDMFDGAFRTIRQNVGATIGIAFLVNLVFLAIPVLGLAILASLGELGSLLPDLEAGQDDPLATGPLVSSLLSAVSTFLAGIVVTGLVVQVVARAAIGEKLTAREAWRRTRPQLLRLVALAIATAVLPFAILALVVVAVIAAAAAGGTVAAVLTGIGLGVGAIVLVVWLWTRFLLLAPCVLVLERAGILASAKRARTLSIGSFWRLLGIYLLIYIAASLAAQLVAIPFALGGVGSLFLIGDETLSELIFLMINNLAGVVSGSLSTPFVGAVVALQYIDVRIRREGLDVRLRQQAARRSGDGPTAMGAAG